MRIYHLATKADWEAARRSGTYTTSTYGRSLQQEGFIHASRREQVEVVLDRFYAEVSEPLVLLEIETDLLDVPWREDPVEDETYPHIYGPLPTRAVVGWRPARTADLETAAGVPATPLLTSAFRGLGLVFVVAGVVLLVFAFVAHHEVDDGTLPSTAEFLLWTSVVTTTACAITCGAIAESMRSRS